MSAVFSAIRLRAPVHQEMYEEIEAMQPLDVLVWKTDNVRSAYESARKRLERLGYSFKLWESSGAIWIVRMS